MKGQVAIEFIALMGIFFFIFLFMFKGATDLKLEVYEKQEEFAVQDMTLRLRQEILTASNAPDGYKREYRMPEVIDRYDYSYRFNTTARYVLVNTSNAQADYAIPLVQASTNPDDRNLTITKKGGIIYVNST